MTSGTGRPLVIAVDGVALSPASDNDITVTINDAGRRSLISCLGRLKTDDLLANGLSWEQVNFLEFLWSVLGGA